jgi:endonuclease III
MITPVEIPRHPTNRYPKNSVIFAANPEPKGELQHINLFTLLVAVVLSAQATDAGVNKATPVLVAAADTPGKMVAA